MRCTLTWLPSADSRLAAIWNNASNRQAISDAANLIDHYLKGITVELKDTILKFGKLVR
jgi:hypothetical protein